MSLSIASETPLLRAAVERQLGWSTGSEWLNEVLFLAQPGVSGSGKPSWLVYESGSVTLRRTLDEREAVTAALFHLLSVEHALRGPLMPTRLRPLLRPDGSVVLIEPRAVHQLAGFDRRLLRRGVTVFPTTIVALDPEAAEIEVPHHELDIALAPGRYPVAQIVLQEMTAGPGPTPSLLLALLRASVRAKHHDVTKILAGYDRFVSLHGSTIRLELTASIDELVASIS